MKASKNIIEKAKNDGTIDRMTCLMSGVQMMLHVSNNFIEECNEIAKRDRLTLGELGLKHAAFVRAADAYFFCFSTMVRADRKMEMFEDMDYLEEKIRAWAGVRLPWRPKELIDGKWVDVQQPWANGELSAGGREVLGTIRTDEEDKAAEAAASVSGKNASAAASAEEKEG